LILLGSSAGWSTAC